MTRRIPRDKQQSLGLRLIPYLCLLLLITACQEVKDKPQADLAKAKEELRSIRLKSGEINVITKLDSIATLAKKYQDDSLGQATTLKKAEYYLALFELAPADSLLDTLSKTTLLSPALTLELYANLSVAELIRDNIAMAISYQRKAIAFAEKHLDEIELATLNSLYINTSLSYSYTDKIDSMRYFLAKGYELAEERKDSIRLANCYAQEASIYSNAFDDEKCAEYLSKAIAITSTQSDRMPNKNVYRLNLGQTLYNAMEIQGVTQSRIDSISAVVSEMIRSEEHNLRRGYILGHGYKLLGYLCTVGKKYHLAEQYLVKADSLTDDPTVESEINKIKLLIKVEGGMRPYQTEADRLEASLAKGIVSPSGLVEGYKVLSQAYKEAGIPHEALRINDSIDKYLDSLRAETKYRETMKLERGRVLQEANNKLKQEQDSNRTLFAWLIGIASLACVVIGGLYYYNKRKHRQLEDTGKLLQSELEVSNEERERIAKELEIVREKLQASSLQMPSNPSELVEEDPRLSPETQENIAEALRLLMYEQRKYRDKTLTLDALSSLIGINRSYVSSYLNHVLGESYSDYIAKLRLDEAKQLLCETEHTLHVIAHLVGFSTQQTFHAQFKKHNEGITPTEYRNNCRK